MEKIQIRMLFCGGHTHFVFDAKLESSTPQQQIYWQINV